MVTRKKQSRKSKVTKKTAKKTIQKGETITLDSILVIDDAMQLHQKLVELVEKKSEVIINAKAVNMIDTAMLQLLTSFVMTLKKQNIKVSWKDPSEELINRATLLNLEKQLEF